MNYPFLKISGIQRDRMEVLISQASSQLRRRFLSVIDDIKNSRSLSEIEDLLSRGRFNEALGSAELHAGRFASEVLGVYVATGRASAELLNDTLDIVFNFDQTNVRAVEQMRQSRLRLIREFTQSQVEATRSALTAGIERGINPRQQAVLFRESVGLTGSQQRSVNNFRLLLESNSREALTRQLRDRRFDRSIESAIRNNQPLSDDQINQMVSRYQERFIKFRSVTIARTEALRAVHQGNKEMFQQAVDNGSLLSEDLIRTWFTARDSRVRDSHVSMNGQVRGLNESFLSGSGSRLEFPGDPRAPASEVVQCRCVVATTIRSLT